jgi:hypothetical protein
MTLKTKNPALNGPTKFNFNNRIDFDKKNLLFVNKKVFRLALT